MLLKSKILLVILFLGKLLFAQDPPGLTFGGIKPDIGYDVIKCSDEGYLIVGTTKSIGAGSSDMIATKLDSKGKIEWLKAYGWPHHDVARSVIEVNNGYILVGDAWDFGYSRLDTYLVMINFDGDLIWDRMYGTDSKDIGFDIIQMPNADLLLLNYTRGFDPAGDLNLIRTDPLGVEIWNKTYGTGYDDYGMEVTLAADGSILVIGTKAGFYNDVYSTYFNVHDADILLINVDEDGNENWRKTYGGNGHDFGYSVLSTDENIFVGGSTQSQGEGSFDMFLMKLDHEGNDEWMVTYGGEDYDYGNSIARNEEGFTYLFGTSKSFGENELPDFYLVKLDDNGDWDWKLAIGGPELEMGGKVIATADGGAAMVGMTNSYGEGSFDILFVKVDKEGQIEELINGIDTIDTPDLLLYPNPASTYARVKTVITIDQRPGLYLELINLSGQLIETRTLNSPDYKFSVENLTSGTYIYRIKNSEDGEVIYTGKLVKR